LSDPKSEIVDLILWTYTIEGLVFKLLNDSLRKGDEGKVDTIGAYSFGLNMILKTAPYNRTDIDKSRFKEGVLLYRGSGETDKEI